jgi:hypothetical protein
LWNVSLSYLALVKVNFIYAPLLRRLAAATAIHDSDGAEQQKGQDREYHQM